MFIKSLYIFITLIGIIFSVEDNDLSILSWNIKMLTAPYGWLHDRIDRAENIIQSIKTGENYDVILFQEAFSGKIRKIMYEGLKEIYPNQIIPDDNTCIGKSNSGLWIISKNPITLIDKISFSNQKNWDALSSKGAQLFSIVQNGQEFHIINTHLQADYKTKYNIVRTQQYTEIYEKLIIPNKDNEIPLILCGDLNISHSNHLGKLVKKLRFKNGPILGKLQFSTLDPPQLLDYILVKSGNFQFLTIERFILKMEKNPYSYSDHLPIQGKFTW